MQKLFWGAYHLTLHATAFEYHMKVDDQIVISSDLTIKKDPTVGMKTTHFFFYEY